MKKLFNLPIYIWGIIGLMIFSTLSCYKEFPEKPFLPLGGYFGNYFAAPGKGSVYIYTDTSGAVFDTCIVTRKMNKTYADRPYINEGYLIEYSCSATLNFQTDITAAESGDYFSVFYKSGTGIQVSRDTDGIYHPKVYVRFLDSMKLHGTVYRDILLAQDEFGPHTQFWFAKDIGIIQKRIRTIYGDSTFSLVDLQLK